MNTKHTKYLKNVLRLVLIILAYTFFFQAMYCWMLYGNPIADNDWPSFLYSIPFNFIPFLIMAIAAMSAVFITSGIVRLWQKICVDLVIVASVGVLLNILFPLVTGLSVNWGGTVFNGVIIWLSIEFWFVNRQKQKALIRESLLLKENAAYRLELLQSYVNPHFLFNSLEMLCSMIELDEKEESLDFIDKLTAYYRGILRHKNVQKVSLGDELDTVFNYLSIMSRHYGDHLGVTVSGDRNSGMFIVPFSIQLLVENVLKHNIISVSSPLTIMIEIKDSSVTVSNPYRPKNNYGGRGMGMGLKYLRGMYASYGKEISVQENGETFSVTVPSL